ncbi:extensin-3 [Drosophila grimshawi]|uniref:GH12026 n=1 Tax=Drosophila grimshawi TaxID=7222 RepID=B4JKN7_DROGR|nr:extensin-3 [Drosophila grimshawi]EDW00140.1 GH12026 [Drosophila grimshawi]
MPKVIPGLLLALVLPIVVSAFGNEYVHIKVHVPKDQAPSIAIDAEPVPPHKVIHHYHHHGSPHQRSRVRAPPKPQSSPLLESVILSDLDKPLHMSEHADYLNHAKEIADHLSESYAAKKIPPPPKKKVKTYTIIEEKQRPNSYEYLPPSDHNVDTYRVISSRPQSHYHNHQQHHQPDDDVNEVGYNYRPPARYHRHKSFSSPSSSSYLGGSYAEPAPVEEPLDLDLDYTYAAPSYANIKSARAPAYTLEAPENTQYSYDFRPSPELHSAPDPYEEEVDAYAAPAPTQSRRHRTSPVEWGTESYSGASESYSAPNSYHAGHVQGVEGASSVYQYPGPYL